MLASLTPGQLRVLRVLHESRWLYKEAAFRLGVPESTVRTSVHRALVRSAVHDRAELAYALGAADEQRRSSHANVRDAKNRANVAGTRVGVTGVLGCVGRSLETTR